MIIRMLMLQACRCQFSNHLQLRHWCTQMARRALPVHAELSSVMAQRARSPDHAIEAEFHQPSVSTANSSISLLDGFRDLHVHHQCCLVLFMKVVPLGQRLVPKANSSSINKLYCYAMTQLRNSPRGLPVKHSYCIKHCNT
jgi:hypothetical protein